MPRDPQKTWQYFAQAVIQEDDPEKLTDLMEQLYRALAGCGKTSFEASRTTRLSCFHKTT